MVESAGQNKFETMWGIAGIVTRLVSGAPAREAQIDV
jgi:hypothetical protein